MKLRWILSLLAPLLALPSVKAIDDFASAPVCIREALPTPPPPSSRREKTEAISRAPTQKKIGEQLKRAEREKLRRIDELKNAGEVLTPLRSGVRCCETLRLPSLEESWPLRYQSRSPPRI